MPSRIDIYKQLKREYDEAQNRAIYELRERRNFAYTRVPRIEEIEREIGLLGVKAARIAINGNDMENKILKLKEDIKILNEEKVKLLKEIKCRPDYLNIIYECEKCQDTGFVDGKECSCFTQRKIELAYMKSNLKEILKNENFDTFDFKYYSDEKDEKYGISPLENIRKIHKVCTQFGENDKFENLFLYGDSGLGKTFLCNCIAEKMLKEDHIVLYVTAPQLFKILSDEQFNNNENDESRKEYIDDITSVDLLIIDDLGTEFSTSFTQTEFFNIINTRMLNRHSTIISSNLSPFDLAEEYSERTMSRIIGNYTALKFFGDDIRLKKEEIN